MLELSVWEGVVLEFRGFWNLLRFFLPCSLWLWWGWQYKLHSTLQYSTFFFFLVVVRTLHLLRYDEDEWMIRQPLDFMTGKQWLGDGPISPLRPIYNTAPNHIDLGWLVKLILNPWAMAFPQTSLIWQLKAILPALADGFYSSRRANGVGIEFNIFPHRHILTRTNLSIFKQLKKYFIGLKKKKIIYMCVCTAFKL